MTSGPSARRLPSGLIVLAALLLLIVPSARAADFAGRLRVTPAEAHRGMLRIEAKDASLRELLAALQVHLDRRIVLQFEGDRLVRLTARAIPAEVAVRQAARSTGLRVAETGGSFTITDPREPVLHLNVKDADVRDILRSVRSQCGIRNLIIDPEVSGRGTFLFADVPCGEGLRVILASLGLGAEIESGLVRVKRSDR